MREKPKKEKNAQSDDRVEKGEGKGKKGKKGKRN
jgi:hypothetical protein